MRILSNGNIAYPKRGNPPEVPIGYKIKDGDPYTMVPVLPDCKFRDEMVIKTACCSSNRIHCSLFKREVTMLICKDCTKYEN